MVGLFIGVLLAGLVYWLCIAIGLPAVVAIIAAVLVLVASAPSAGHGIGHRRSRGP